MQWDKVLISLLLCCAPALAAPEREIAVWVIRQGGRVIIDNQRRPLNDLLQLPPGDFHLTGVDLTGTLIVAEDLARLSSLAQLKELSQTRTLEFTELQTAG
jgi:hypothetical protein